jgi:hypothetical protein
MRCVPHRISIRQEQKGTTKDWAALQRQSASTETGVKMNDWSPNMCTIPLSLIVSSSRCTRVNIGRHKQKRITGEQKGKKKPKKKSGKKETLDEMRYIDIETAGIEEEEQ